MVMSHPFPRGLSALRSEGGLLASGPTDSRLPGSHVATQWLRLQAACYRHPRSQWRVRAGLSPASLSTDLGLKAGCYRPASVMTVNLTRIYTRLGDDGETHLGDMSRVPKTHPRIEAYGDVDELNAQLGLALATGALPGQQADWVRRIQNDLFDVGADISVPHGGDRERLRLQPEQTAWLEQRCDEVNATLEPLRSFVLPGGTAAAAQLHVARTVCRRAERRTIDAGDDVNPECVKYLNRLSDLFFILSRGANGGDEPLWEPGRYR